MGLAQARPNYTKQNKQVLSNYLNLESNTDQVEPLDTCLFYSSEIRISVLHLSGSDKEQKKSLKKAKEIESDRFSDYILSCVDDNLPSSVSDIEDDSPPPLPPPLPSLPVSSSMPTAHFSVSQPSCSWDMTDSFRPPPSVTATFQSSPLSPSRAGMGATFQSSPLSLSMAGTCVHGWNTED